MIVGISTGERATPDICCEESDRHPSGGKVLHYECEPLQSAGLFTADIVIPFLGQYLRQRACVPRRLQSEHAGAEAVQESHFSHLRTLSSAPTLLDFLVHNINRNHPTGDGSLKQRGVVHSNH